MPPHSSSVNNKIAREKLYKDEKRLKAKSKLERRKEFEREERDAPEKRAKRLAENVPQTIESKRVFDETLTQKGDEEDEELLADAENDPFAEYFANKIPPKMLITTSKNPTVATYDFAGELIDVFPNAEYVKRGNKFELDQICKFASNRGYTDLLLVNEDQKKPNAVTLVHLPSGPTMHFTVSSIVLTRKIHNHGRATSHSPELILNNFSTSLGRTLGRHLQSLFPPSHNSKAVKSSPRHRYVFRDVEKVRLQELGPRFTLKLRRVTRGVPGRRTRIEEVEEGKEVEWEWRADADVDRRKFAL
ncbi:Ribosome production factor 1 [Saitoella coloradoensis]